MKRLILAAWLCTLVACGGGSPPTSPTSPAGGATRIINISGSLAFGDVTVGNSANATITVTNSGTGTLSVTSLSATSGLSSVLQASWTSGQILPGAAQTITVQFTPTAAQSYSGTLTIVDDHTSGANTLPISGVGVTVTKPPTTNLTLSGTVTDGTSHGVLPNINIQIGSGPNAGRSTRTDGSGNYTLGDLTSGTFTVAASAASYDTTTQSVTLAAANGRLDFNLPRSGTAPSPAPTPTPTPSSAAVEYVITGTARRCSATYVNASGGTDQTEVNIPFTYSWPTARSGDFLYMSCQIDTGGDTGSITITLRKNGAAIQTATANGFPNIATVSGVY